MRLSSIASFPFSSQPELFTRAELPMATSVAPADPFPAFQMREAESFQTQHMEDFFSSNSASNHPIELNPYHHFASERSGAASPHIYRPSQQTYHDGQDITKTNSVVPFWQIQADTPLQGPVSVLDLHTTAHPTNNSTLEGSLPVEQLDDNTLSKAADYRAFLPQARSLPFIPTNAKVGSASAGTKSTAKRKSVQVGENAKTSPSKRKQPTKKKVPENKKTVKPQPKARRQPKGQLISDQTEARQSSVASQNPVPKGSAAKQGPSDSNPGVKLLSKKNPPKQFATVQKAGEEEASPVDETPATKALPKKKTPKSASVQKPTPAKPGKGRPRKGITANDLEPSKTVTGNSAANMIDDSPPNKATPQRCPKILAVPSDCEDEGINSHNYSKKFNGATNVFRTDVSLINCESSSTLMIAESAMLNALNRMTWKIIDQYEADIDEGLNRFEIAQYYTDNLHNTRFIFWYDKLAELGSLSPLHARQPIS
ncbi:hypothetical protein NLG97_g4477 [Lecanicillium saksenae]|uniref:Uncharacterized protein n=1 Tax=Lecanicillium saksenae TaxID=468837 RepID=A0ACC1QVC4_9HYPO|nr:hypothetical protein NLG97_g4477 [Lecanicillium saksenae]